MEEFYYKSEGEKGFFQYDSKSKGHIKIPKFDCKERFNIFAWLKKKAKKTKWKILNWKRLATLISEKSLFPLYKELPEFNKKNQSENGKRYEKAVAQKKKYKYLLDIHVMIFN